MAVNKKSGEAFTSFVLSQDVRHVMWDVVAIHGSSKGEILDNAVAELISLAEAGEFEPDPQYRKPGADAKVFNIKLHHSMYRDLRRIAKRHGVSMGALLREAVTSYVALCDEGIIKP